MHGITGRAFVTFGKIDHDIPVALVYGKSVRGERGDLELDRIDDRTWQIDVGIPGDSVNAGGGRETVAARLVAGVAVVSTAENSSRTHAAGSVLRKVKSTSTLPFHG